MIQRASYHYTISWPSYTHWPMAMSSPSQTVLVLMWSAHSLYVRSEIQSHPIPFYHLILNIISFEHLSLYIQKHLSQSLTVCGISRPQVDMISAVLHASLMPFLVQDFATDTLVCFRSHKLQTFGENDHDVTVLLIIIMLHTVLTKTP